MNRRRLKRAGAFLAACIFAFQSTFGLGSIKVRAETGEEPLNDQGRVIIKYLEKETEKELAPDYYETGNDGETYQGPDKDGNLGPLELDGYDFVRTGKPEILAEDEEGNPIWDEDTCQSVFIAGETQVIKHYYESNRGSVSVAFQDADTGKEIPAKEGDAWYPYKETGKAGDPYVGRDQDGYLGKVKIPGYLYYGTIKPDRIATDETGHPIWNEETCQSLFLKQEDQEIIHQYVKEGFYVSNEITSDRHSIGNGNDLSIHTSFFYEGNTNVDSLATEIKLPDNFQGKELTIPAADHAEGVNMMICSSDGEKKNVLSKDKDAGKAYTIDVPSEAKSILFLYQGKIKGAGIHKESLQQAFAVKDIKINGQARYSGKKESVDQRADVKTIVKRDGKKKEEANDRVSFLIEKPSVHAPSVSAPEYTHRYDQSFFLIGDLSYHGPKIELYQLRVFLDQSKSPSVKVPKVSSDCKEVSMEVLTNKRTVKVQHVAGGSIIRMDRLGIHASERVEQIILFYHNVSYLRIEEKGEIRIMPLYQALKDGQRVSCHAQVRAYTCENGSDGKAYYTSADSDRSGVLVSSAAISGAFPRMPERILEGESFELEVVGLTNISTAHVDQMASETVFSSSMILEEALVEQGDNLQYQYLSGGSWLNYSGQKNLKIQGFRTAVKDPSKGYQLKAPELNLRSDEQKLKKFVAVTTSSVTDNGKTYQKTKHKNELFFYDMKSEMEFTQAKDTLVSGETTQTYRLSFHKSQVPSGLKTVAFQVDLDQKFVPKELRLGTWKDYQGNLLVTCQTKNHRKKNLGTFQSGKTVALPSDAKSIEIQTDKPLGPAASAQGVLIYGKTVKKPDAQKVLAKASFLAVYGERDKSIKADMSLTSHVFYYAITVPSMKLKSDQLFYGEKTIMTIDRVASLGNCRADTLDLKIKMPEKVSLEKVLLPEYIHQGKDLKIVFVYDNGMSKSFSPSLDAFLPDNRQKKYIKEIHFVQDQVPGGLQMTKGITVAVKNTSKVKRAFLTSAKLTARFGKDFSVSKQSDIYNVRLLAEKKNMIISDKKTLDQQPIRKVHTNIKPNDDSRLWFVLGAAFCLVGGFSVYLLRKKKKDQKKN